MRPVVRVAVLIVAGACRPGAGANPIGTPRIERDVTEALAAIVIPNADDVRGNVILPSTLAALPGVAVSWTSSDRTLVGPTARARGARGGRDDVRP